MKKVSFLLILVLFTFALAGIASACQPITGNPIVDNACCATDNHYSVIVNGPYGNHGDYVSCVAQKVVDLRMGGQIDQSKGGEIIRLAGQSAVNMPSTSKQAIGLAISLLKPGSPLTGIIAIVAILAIVGAFLLRKK